MFKKLFAFGFVASCGTGAYLAHRHKIDLITKAREAIHEERRLLGQEFRHIEDDIKKEQAELERKLATQRRRLTAVETLWADREERYDAEVQQCNDFIWALPEAMSVMRGMINHYSYMMQSMPRYAEYDFFSSRLHTFGALLEAARSRATVVPSPTANAGATTAAEKESASAAAGVGPVRNLGLSFSIPQFRFLFGVEPLVSSVLDSVDAAVLGTMPPKPEDCATSVKQLNDVFRLSQKQLMGAVEAHTTFVAEHAKSEDEMAGNNKGAKASAAGAAYVDRSVVLDGAKTLAALLHVEETKYAGAARPTVDPANTDEETLAAVRTAAAKRYADETMKRQAEDAVTLRNRDDLLAAINYVADLQDALSQHRQSQQKRKDATEFLPPKAVAAIHDLGVWKMTAERYLVEEQALDVMDSYYLCLHSAATRLTEAPAEPPAQK